VADTVVTDLGPHMDTVTDLIHQVKSLHLSNAICRLPTLIIHIDDTDIRIILTFYF